MNFPSLKTLIHGAHRMGAVTNRMRISKSEAMRIRNAEKRGGHEAGLIVVLQILREKNHAADVGMNE